MDITFKQIGTLIVAVVIGGGFAFMGMASYAGMINTGNANQNQDQQQFNATLPDQNYQEEAFDLTRREQRILAVQNDVVFLNGFYSTESGKEELQNLENIPSKFGNRVYLSVASNSSNADVMYSYSITNFPKVVAIAGNRRYRGGPLTSTSEQKVSQEVCDGFRSLGNQAGNCLS